jgi:hypothetical protein
MTITRTIGKMPTATTDNNVDVAILDKTKLSLLSSVVNGNLRTAKYVYADGDKSYEASLEVRISLDAPKVADALQHVSVKYTTRQLLADSVTGLTTIGKPVSFFIGYEVPLEGTVTNAELMLGFSTIFGATLGTITAGVAADTIINDLGFLIPTAYS